MAGMTLLQICASYTEADDLIEALRTLAKCDSGVAEGCEDSFCIGVMSAFIAGLNKDAVEAEAVEPRPLSNSQIDELLVGVSISKLERLLAERRAELGDTFEEVQETLEVVSPWCMFPDCRQARLGDSLYCAMHTEDDRPTDLNRMCCMVGCQDEVDEAGVYCPAHRVVS